MNEKLKPKDLKPNFKDLPDNKQERFREIKDRIIEKSREHDVVMKERKAHLIEVVKELIISEKIDNPAQKLTKKLLKDWIGRYPDKFLGLTNVDSTLQTYFYGDMENLKFSLGLIN